MNHAAKLAATSAAQAIALPVFLKILGVVGTAAMIWVRGGIIVHGLETYGAPWIGHAIHNAAEAAAHSVPLVAGLVEWIVTAAGSGLAALLVGALLIPITGYFLAPAWKWVGGLRGKAA